MSHETVTVEGRVWGVFAHRFAVETTDGKVLADLRPDSVGRITLREGDRVSLSGERKRSAIKVGRLTMPDGVEHRISGPKHGGHYEDDADPAIALDAVRAQGYRVTGAPRRKPKHWDVDAMRGDDAYVLHVELDGRIRKVKDASD